MASHAAFPYKSVLCPNDACLVLTGGVALADEESEEGKEEEETEEVQEGKFLALPIFITEPAIGEGLGVGLVYFHPQKPVELTENSDRQGGEARRASIQSAADRLRCICGLHE